MALAEEVAWMGLGSGGGVGRGGVSWLDGIGWGVGGGAGVRALESESLGLIIHWRQSPLDWRLVSWTAGRLPLFGMGCSGRMSGVSLLGAGLLG